jgi:hypothetical protein
MDETPNASIDIDQDRRKSLRALRQVYYRCGFSLPRFTGDGRRLDPKAVAMPVNT